jgi:ribonuclease PH
MNQKRERSGGRKHDEIRPLVIEPGFIGHAEGSVLVTAGRTRVVVTASVEDRVPMHLKDKKQGWVTSEYGMRPRATAERTQREATRGRLGGRTMEIQRIVGRALRAVTDLGAFGERTIWIDCDVLEADGGTRCASITGASVALALAFAKMRGDGKVQRPPLRGLVAAVSVGVVDGRMLLDLDYPEDSAAEVDMNVARTDDGRYIEIQGTAERAPFARPVVTGLLDLADSGLDAIAKIQRRALGDALAPLLAPAPKG